VDETGLWCLLVAVICIFFTTFFSVANLSLRHVSLVKLHEAFNRQGHAGRTGIIRRHLTQLISATAALRLLTNLILLLCVVYRGCQTTSGLLWPMARAFLISALALSIFSVAIPHAWAKYAGTAVLVYGYGVLRLLGWITWPLTSMLHLFDPVIRRLAGVAQENSDARLEEKQEELLNVVEEGKNEGVVDEEEREMIASVLELGDSTAGEIMTPRTEVVGIEANATLTEVVDMVIRQGHSRYPVYDESIDKIIGMLYAKDLLHDLKNPNEVSDVRHRMRRPYFVPETKTLRDLLHDFQNQKIHLAVVLDEYGGTAGVVTIEDILEEIVGEIVDEYEPPQAEPLQKIDEHTIEVDARYEVDELNDEFDLNIPEDADYETIGGFVFAQLGCIPPIGQTFEHENLHFTIVDVGQRKINRLRIEIKEKPAEQEH